MINKDINIRINIDGIFNIDKRRSKYNNITEQERHALEFIQKLSKNFTVIMNY